MIPTEYELVLMLDPQAADEQRAKVTGDTKSRIEGAGTLKHEGEWGVRKMAYEIKQRNEAEYRIFRFEGEKPLLDDLDHSLKIADGVLRFRIFKTDPESPNTIPPDTFVIMQRNEDDERPRGRGRGEGRGPRRPRDDERGAGDAPAQPAAVPAVAAEVPAEAAEAPAEAIAVAPAVEVEAPVEPAAEEAPAEPAAEAAPVEPAAEAAAEAAPVEPAAD